MVFGIQRVRTELGWIEIAYRDRAQLLLDVFVPTRLREDQG